MSRFFSVNYHLHWLTSLETSRHFRKIALRLGIFLAMLRECWCVVARQLAPKCHDFSNVAKLARQCKWPYCNLHFYFFPIGWWIFCCSHQYLVIPQFVSSLSKDLSENFESILSNSVLSITVFIRIKYIHVCSMKWNISSLMTFNQACSPILIS